MFDILNSKSRTSTKQFNMIVEFMERHGDLSKNMPKGQLYTMTKWSELTNLLNSEGSTLPRTSNKWRKVWSDLKNNTKRKMARLIHTKETGTKLNTYFTELELRVLRFLKSQTPNSSGTIEVEYLQDDEVEYVVQEEDEHESEEINEAKIRRIAAKEIKLEKALGHDDACSNLVTVNLSPGPSNDVDEDPLFPTESTDEEDFEPPRKRTKKQDDDVLKMLLESNRIEKKAARNRDKFYEKLETDRLRQRDEELRLREVELKLQAQWLQFMRDAMGVFVRYMDKQNK